MARSDIVFCLVFMVLSPSVFFVQCTDKIFITDVSDGKIFVGENRGPDFHGEDISEVTLRGVQAPTGIDYDYRTDTIYWTDEGTRTVNRAFLNGSNQEVLLDQRQGIGYPQGIVLDLILNKMFWSDTLLERITSANLDGSNRRTIISTGLYLPWGITLSQKRGTLYWTDEGVFTGKIETSNKDGTNRRQLITDRLIQPHGLALDSQEQRLYWTEGYYDVIESIDLDDLSDRREHVYAERADILVFGISLYFTSIYFTDFSSRGLHEADIGVSEIRNIIGFTEAPTHVKIYTDLTCSVSCPGNSQCQLITYNTSECTCIYGWGGLNCGTRVTCTLPDSPPLKTSFVNPQDSYTASTIVTVMCDDGSDQVEWTCNGYTGNWDGNPVECSTSLGADKIFITDVSDGKIFVGKNRGPDFHGEDITEVTLSGVQAPTGIDYDYRTDKIYWSDEEARTLSRASLDGSNQETLLDQNQGIGYPQGIVLDLLLNKMFWSDSLLERITSANLDGSNRRTIISTGLYLPWAITLSQKRGKLYWSDEGVSTGKIEMSNKDGTDRRQLITTRLTQPYGLALDSQEQRLYWTEGYYDVIESIDLDDLSDRRDHVYAKRGDIVVFGISLYYTSIYFTDFSSRGLHEADIGVTEIREITGFTAAPTHVKIYADLTCFVSCTGNSRCQLIAYNTPECYCIYGWGGLNCDTRVTCTLPDSPPLKTSFVNPQDSYTASTIVTVMCDDGSDQVEWTCNGYTGNWDEDPINCSTQSAPSAPSGGTSVGLIAVIACGVVLFLLLLLIYLVYRVKRKPRRSSSSEPVQNAASPLSVVFTAGAEPGAVISPHASIPGHPSPRYTPGPAGAMPGNVNFEEKKHSEHEYESTLDVMSGSSGVAAAVAYRPGYPVGQAYPMATGVPPPYSANVQYRKE